MQHSYYFLAVSYDSFRISSTLNAVAGQAFAFSFVAQDKLGNVRQFDDSPLQVKLTISGDSILLLIYCYSNCCRLSFENRKRQHMLQRGPPLQLIHRTLSRRSLLLVLGPIPFRSDKLSIYSA